VRTKTGPHVTPELFARHGDRIVCLTAASTLKAKHARSDPTVAIAASGDGDVLAAVATAVVLDPADPRTALREPTAALASPLGVARFLRDNLGESAGAAVDALAGRLGVLPERRIVLSLTLVEAVVHERADEDVVLGWTRADGTPLALPARWERDRATVSRALFDGMGAAAASPACVTVDETTATGPTGKQGVMLRGRGRAEVEGELVRVRLDVDRTTWWDGTDTGTVVEPA
jgi:hypothetical protein